MLSLKNTVSGGGYQPTTLIILFLLFYMLSSLHSSFWNLRFGKAYAILESGHSNWEETPTPCCKLIFSSFWDYLKQGIWFFFTADTHWLAVPLWIVPRNSRQPFSFLCHNVVPKLKKKSRVCIVFMKYTVGHAPLSTDASGSSRDSPSPQLGGEENPFISNSAPGNYK